MSDYFVHQSAVIDDGVTIGSGSKVWHFCHLSNGASIGVNCVLGQNVYVGPGVQIGDGTKIQNNVSVYAGVTIGRNVFLGPSAVFTNVKNPRAGVDRRDEFDRTEVGDGVTIGANATIVCGNQLGAYCFVGAGAVVTSDTPPHALMLGNPATQKGWMCNCGERLNYRFEPHDPSPLSSAGTAKGGRVSHFERWHDTSETMNKGKRVICPRCKTRHVVTPERCIAIEEGSK